MEPLDPSIGQRIAATRQRRGLRQYALAKDAAMPVSTLNRIERGQQSMHAERLRTLAVALAVSTDYLLGLTGAPAVPRACPVHPGTTGEQKAAP